MAVCSMGYDHAEAEPVAEAEAMAVAAEANAEAEVEVARIQAERDVAVAKIEARSVDVQAEADTAALLARLDVLETWRAEILAAQAPPEPEPVVIPVSPPQGAPDATESIPDIPPPPSGKSKKGYWQGYRR